LDPTPEPSDEDDEEEEEEEEDDLFGGSKGEGDPAAKAKALAEKQMKEAMDMAQGKCTLS